MRALVTGAGGQLGLELIAAAPAGTEVVAATRDDLDITNDENLHDYVCDVSPDVVLNAAAYTAVDQAEEAPREAAAVNVAGVGLLASAAAEAGARLIHVSTDFVFDGAADEPYRPDDDPNPLSVYARSKLEGERAALGVPGSVVVRTSRVYSRLGHNFVTSMLDLMGTRDELNVVDDQVGSPTWAHGLADVLWRFAMQPELTGIWHWSDSGSCSWYQWACAIQDHAIERGLLDRTIPIRPVATSEYPTLALRPAYSVLDSSATCAALEVDQNPWEDSLGSMLDQMATPTAS